jgi:hypothetical protein
MRPGISVSFTAVISKRANFLSHVLNWESQI